MDRGARMKGVRLLLALLALLGGVSPLCLALQQLGKLELPRVDIAMLCTLLVVAGFALGISTAITINVIMDWTSEHER